MLSPATEHATRNTCHDDKTVNGAVSANSSPLPLFTTSQGTEHVLMSEKCVHARLTLAVCTTRQWHTPGQRLLKMFRAGRLL